jgi:hypothetical protein
VAGTLTATRVHRRAFGAGEWGSLSQQLAGLASNLADVADRLGTAQQQQQQQHAAAGGGGAAAAKPVRA